MEEEGERGGVKEEKGFQKEVREQGPHTSIFIGTKNERREIFIFFIFIFLFYFFIFFIIFIFIFIFMPVVYIEEVEGFFSAEKRRVRKENSATPTASGKEAASETEIYF